MKLFKLSSTSKLFLLTLLLVSSLMFIKASVFAHSSEGGHTTSEKRIDAMELYDSWIKTNQYGEFKNETGKVALAKFKSFLETSLPEDKDCLTPKVVEPSPLQRIQSFFSNLITPDKTVVPDQTLQKLSECKGKIKADFKLSKKYNRLLKYLQIEEGRPNLCVKADLGVGTTLKARGFNPAKVNSDNPKETGRTGLLQVYLCTGEDAKKKVRVVDDSGTKLRLSPEDEVRTELKKENLPPKGSLEKLMDKLELK